MNTSIAQFQATTAAAVSSSAKIAVALRQAIHQGELAFGEKLPPERMLAEQFNASRNTIREALRQLEEIKLVSRRIGSGTFVIHKPKTDRDDAAIATSPLELVEVRLSVEPHMTRLAVQNAGASNLQKMEEALHRLESSAQDPRQFSLADEAFHLALAECTRNPLMVWLYRQVNEVRGNTMWFEAREKILTPARITEYNKEHRQLYEYVRGRQVENAVKLIAGHLDQVRVDLIGASQES